MTLVLASILAAIAIVELVYAVFVNDGPEELFYLVAGVLTVGAAVFTWSHT